MCRCVVVFNQDASAVPTRQQQSGARADPPASAEPSAWETHAEVCISAETSAVAPPTECRAQSYNKHVLLGCTMSPHTCALIQFMLHTVCDNIY